MYVRLNYNRGLVWFVFLLQTQLFKLALCVYQKPSFFDQTRAWVGDFAMQIPGYALPILTCDRRRMCNGRICLGGEKQWQQVHCTVQRRGDGPALERQRRRGSQSLAEACKNSLEVATLRPTVYSHSKLLAFMYLKAVFDRMLNTLPAQHGGRNRMWQERKTLLV